jgi:Uncharacterized protein involved in cytokinesis, contains TGc (transglutaminase/protease-like) domain
MKRTVSFICGFLAGSLLFGGGAVCASGILAEPSAQRVFVNGKETQMEAYLIDGHNYLQLRDVGQAVGFNVYWDYQTRTVHIDSSQPYTGIAPEVPPVEEAGVQDDEDFNAAVLTGAYTREAFTALRSAVVSGTGSEAVFMSEETRQAMLEAAAAVGCWPVYDLKAQGNYMYCFQARYPEPYEEAAEYCQPFVDSLAGLTEREKARQIAFYVCDRLVYAANATSSPRTALTDDGEHKGNCTSYSHCFKFLCDLAGIPCIFTHSADHQWNVVYIEGQWWHVNVSGADVSDPSLRPKLPVLKTEDELQGSIFTQSQPWLTELVKELMVPGSSK